MEGKTVLAAAREMSTLFWSSSCCREASPFVSSPASYETALMAFFVNKYNDTKIEIYNITNGFKWKCIQLANTLSGTAVVLFPESYPPLFIDGARIIVIVIIRTKCIFIIGITGRTIR